jgi:intein-encoded DNA endonuclease-like protein
MTYKRETDAIRYVYNTSVFTNEDDISYYLLGLYMTDGNIYLPRRKGNQNSGDCSIHLIDRELVERIRDIVCPNKPVIIRKRKEKTKSQFRFRMSNKTIVNWFLKKGCVPNKTNILKFPDVPQTYLFDFIRGLIDGDGSIGFYNGNRAMIRFDTASLGLITSLRDILNNYGIRCKISKTPWFTSKLNNLEIKSTMQMYRIAINGLGAYKLLKMMYKNDRLSLSRKKSLTQNIYSFIERNGFTEEELMKMDKLAIKKWPTDSELFNLAMKHNGVMARVAEELDTFGFIVSNRLRKIGTYNAIRKIYPIDSVRHIHCE